MKKSNILFSALIFGAAVLSSCDKNGTNTTPSTNSNDTSLRRNPTVDIKARAKNFEGRYYYHKGVPADSSNWIEFKITDTTFKLLNTGKYANVITDSFDCRLELKLVKGGVDTATLIFHGVWQDDGSNSGAKANTSDGLYLDLATGTISGLRREDLQFNKNGSVFYIFGEAWYQKWD